MSDDLGAKRPARWLSLLAASTLIVVACGDSGPDATPVETTETACASNFCVEFPVDWVLTEAGDDFVSFEHPAAPDQLVATVGQVNMEGVVTQAGGSWPALPDDVVRSFWTLLEDAGASLSTLDPRRDGSVASLGSFEDGRLWILLAPVNTTDAVGVEVRAPNTTWAGHVDVFFDSLRLIE